MFSQVFYFCRNKLYFSCRIWVLTIKIVVMIFLKISIYAGVICLVTGVLGYLLRSWFIFENPDKNHLLVVPKLNIINQLPGMIKANTLLPIYNFLFVWGISFFLLFLVIGISLSMILFTKSVTGYYIISAGILFSVYIYIAKSGKFKKANTE